MSEHGDDRNLPPWIKAATPKVLLSTMSRKEIYLCYEERHLNVEFEVRYCKECDGGTRHQIVRDHFRGRIETNCPNCSRTSVRWSR